MNKKQLMSNLFVTNLSDICDREGKILKKQLKLICLLSMRWGMLLKAEGNFQNGRNWNIEKICVGKVYKNS